MKNTNRFLCYQFSVASTRQFFLRSVYLQLTRFLPKHYTIHCLILCILIVVGLTPFSLASQDIGYGSKKDLEKLAKIVRSIEGARKLNPSILRTIGNRGGTYKGGTYDFYDIHIAHDNIRALSDIDSDIRLIASLALLELGKKSEFELTYDIIPGLIDELNNDNLDDTHIWACAILVIIGLDSEPELREAIKRGDSTTRKWAEYALAIILVLTNGIPEDALNAICDSGSKNCKPEEFNVRRIDLNDDEVLELIIDASKNPGFQGSGGYSSWLFQRIGRKYVLVKEFFGYDVRILKTETLGYKDLILRYKDYKNEGGFEIGLMKYIWNGKTYEVAK